MMMGSQSISQQRTVRFNRRVNLSCSLWGTACFVASEVTIDLSNREIFQFSIPMRLLTLPLSAHF